MLKFMKQFAADEDGAVTVDWVVLTAAVVGLAAASVAEIRGSSGALSGQTADYLNRQDASSRGNIQDFVNRSPAGNGNNTPPDQTNTGG